MNRLRSVEREPSYGAAARESPQGMGPSVSEGRTRRRLPPERPATLSRLEETVVALSAFDHPRTVRPAGRVARALQRLFGNDTDKSLANSRLEALRRYALLYRVEGASMSPEEGDMFEASGFSRAAGAQVRCLVDSARKARRA